LSVKYRFCYVVEADISIIIQDITSPVDINQVMLSCTNVNEVFYVHEFLIFIAPDSSTWLRITAIDLTNDL